MSSFTLEQWPFSPLTTSAIAIVLVYAILYQWQYVKVDAREPPVVGSSLPFLGPPLNMVVQGGKYVKNLGIAHRDKRIFTLALPAGSRMYVVTDPALASAVQRASKALSFGPIVPEATKRVVGLADETVVQINRNLESEDPDQAPGYLADLEHSTYSLLGPGEPLRELTLGAAQELARQVSGFAAAAASAQEQEQTTPVDLLSWVQHLVTVGTANFLYGPHNPIAAHPSLEQAFWDWDHGLGPLLINVLPAVTAPRPYRGREALVRAFGEYIDGGHIDGEGAAAVARAHLENGRRHGFSRDAQARSALAFLFAGIVNTSVTGFWLVLRVFADRGLLEAVRGEVERLAVVRPDGEGVADEGEDGEEEVVLSLEAVRTQCRTLYAAFRECLRVGSDNYGTRLVKEDTLLAGRHFLKKGSMLQISGGTIHADEAIWGAGAADADGGFDPERFLRIDRRERAVHPAAFRGFGGGKTLCPGRHFAASEVLCLAAAVVVLFDVEGEGEGGERLRVPRKNDAVLPIHVLEPRAGDRVPARVRVRDGQRRRVRVVA